jgi:4-carboxymuconolactone decarboxylase
MKKVIAAAAISMMLADLAAAEPKRGETMLNVNPSSLSVADIESVSPALARF